MQKYNTGLVYTNDNCIGCNKCVSVCPNKGANISIFEGTSSKVHVLEEYCTNCGDCIRACKHNAREYRDDTEEFFAALKRGEKISVIIPSVFYFLFEKEADNILGYLKHCGVNMIYDAGFGTEIALWANIQYLEDNADNPDAAFIGNLCPAILSDFRKYYPELIDYLIPIQSPGACMAIYANKYLGDDSKYASISPCISRKSEYVKDQGQEVGSICYNVTLENLIKYIGRTDISGYSAKADVSALGFGKLFHIPGMFKEYVSMFFGYDKLFYRFEGLSGGTLEIIRSFIKTKDAKPLFAELVNCKNGCFRGSGVPVAKEDFGVLTRLYGKTKHELEDELKGTGSYKTNRKLLEEKAAEIGLHYEDFTTVLTADPVVKEDVSREAIEAVFEEMRKKPGIERSIDCGSCGYATCVDMAKAIVTGNNKKENCIRYMNDEIVMQYYTDHLTGLYSQPGFTEFAPKFVKGLGEQDFCVAVVELNQLSMVNGLYGFSVGDAFIRAASEYVKEIVGPHAVIGRVGGGRFVICGRYNEKVISNLKKTLSFDFNYLGIAFPISYRLGIAVGKAGSLVEDAYNNAVLTLERIPGGATNSILYYDDALKKKIDQDIMVAANMSDALKNGEFVPYLQPQYDHRTRMVVGAEVLCRWKRPDGSMISPGAFIPVFERNGFIHDLDHYMWERSFECIKEWSEEGINPVPISVNVSRVSLMNKDFLETVRKLSTEYKIDNRLLHFEITESAYAKDQDDVIAKIEGLHEMGFEVAMDDFGTGYSSLNTLKDLPFDILKLDMGFLRAGHVENGEKIIRHIVSMAKDINLATISEGVETEEQADFLLEQGCYRIQGYYYAKPMPLEDYEKILRERLK